MNLFDVYSLFPIEPVKGRDCYLWDREGNKYLDLYGGHAVISIGHSHPHYLRKLNEQLHRIGYYSNSVQNSLQTRFAELLGEISGYPGYRLFLCNSGAEANENALKLASFFNGKRKVIAFRGSFHGRTSAALAVTDNPTLRAPLNQNENVIFSEMNDEKSVQNCFAEDDICAVIIEGIQGVAGIKIPEPQFLKNLERQCRENGAIFILDEVQSGYGRSGKFFAHQFAGIQPDLISVAKGMGNGFPIAGVLIHPKFQAKQGMLGTTFGGNHLACAAGIAVLETIQNENLMKNAVKTGNYLMQKLKKLGHQIKEVRGMGLMIGIELPYPSANIRKRLLLEENIFTGGSSDKNTLRILPPLTLRKSQADVFLQALSNALRAV